ncbi:hypothetical protein [Vibrio phage VP-1]|uniref:ParB/Sulfiredoxin domain-containing protein n=1 Tax=Vibrio phage VP-1 TaxID=2234088 RepID=A0A4P2TEZ2_9CAUD|nr:hypothetical protein [Vibrio phage VP-1]
MSTPILFFRDVLTVINNLQVPAGNLGVTRRNMPQIDEDMIDTFLSALESEKIGYKNDSEYANTLKLTQSEVNKSKVWHIIRNMRRSGRGKGRFPRIFVSRDNYVLDGSHRLVAALNINRRMKMQIVRVDMNAYELITMLKKDPQKFGVRYRSYTDSE